MAALIPIAIFTRAPIAGLAKTRLAPAVGTDGAARLARAFLEDVVSTVISSSRFDASLWCAGDPDDAALRAFASLPRRRQPDGDLGHRMAAALEEGIVRGGRAIVIGSDLPTLPPAILDAAASALDRGDPLVLGPSTDGGYYLVGATARVPSIFDAIPWSTPRVLTATLAAARRADLRPTLLSPWYDVDDPDDLRLLRAHLAVSPSRAPATAAVLRAIGG